MPRFFPTFPRRNLFLAAAILALELTGCKAPELAGDTAVVLLEMRPQTLDPLRATNALSQKIDNLIHASLVRFSPEQRLEGDLASRWESHGYRKFRFTLRPGLRFQDGSPLTPADVIRSIRAFQAPGPNAVAFEHITKVWSEGPLDIQFETDRPQPFLLNDFPLLKIFKGSVAAGRFRLVSDLSNEIVLESAQPSEGGLRVIRLRYVADDTTRYQLLVRGDGNVALNALSLTKTQYLRDHLPNDLLILDSPGINYSYLCFNFRDARLAKLKVRQAIAHAIDKPAILKYRIGGFGYPATGILAPAHADYYESAVERYELNRARAEQLLDEAGYPRKGPGGWRFSISFKTTTEKFGNDMAQLLASQLRAIGIDVRLDVVEQGTFFADINAGNFQLFHSRWIGVSSPAIYFRALHSSQGKALNRGAYSNPQLDALIEKGMNEVDDRRRKAYFSAVQKLVARDLPYVSLWHWNNTFIGNRRMHNVVMYPNGDYRTLEDLQIQPRIQK